MIGLDIDLSGLRQGPKSIAWIVVRELAHTAFLPKKARDRDRSQVSDPELPKGNQMDYLIPLLPFRPVWLACLPKPRAGGRELHDAHYHPGRYLRVSRFRGVAKLAGPAS